MVKVTQIDTNNQKQVKQFQNFPFQLYRATPQWVPPLDLDVKKMLDRKRHPFYQHSQAAFFLAIDNNEGILGRLAVLDNHRYNEYNQERTAFFYLFECKNHPEASNLLFEAAFNWARERCLNKITGPKGFTALDGMGLLVKGFDYRPAFGIPYNLEYYAQLLENAGFQTCGEIVSGYLDRNSPFPERIHRASEIIQRRRGLHVSNFSTRKDLRLLIPQLKKLYNEAVQGTEGNVPLTDEEVDTLTDQMLWFADPRLIKIIFKGDLPVGFLLAYPDISTAMQRTRGRIFPFGWIVLWLELKRTKWININGAGIIEEYRGLGGTAILFSEMQKSVVNSRYIYADIVQIGVENERMQRELSDLGIDFHKTHRLYQRNL